MKGDEMSGTWNPDVRNEKCCHDFGGEKLEGHSDAQAEIGKWL